MDKLPDPVVYAVPAFILLLIAEMVYSLRKDRSRYEARDTLTSLMLGTVSQVAGALVGAAVVGMSVWVYQYRLFDIGIEFRTWWWAWILCFFLDDLAYYVFHRSAHRVRWFWASHVIHHSSQHYNLSTALRQTWTGFFSLTFLFRLPLFLIGFPPAMVFFCAGLNLIYQFWIHTEAIGRMPRWFEAVMNTPSHHRVHHGVNPRYLDANYARRLHHLGPDVRQLRRRARRRAGALRHRQATRQLQHPMGRGPRMGRHREGRLARAVAAQTLLYVARAGLEPRRQPRDERDDQGTLGGGIGCSSRCF